MRRCVIRIALAVALAVVPSAHADEPINFNRDIRPILSENCFYCHGQDRNKRAADLRLDVRDAAVEKGAIAPGNLDESELIARIRTYDASLLMPPPKSNRKLSDAQKALLERWIKDGAVYEIHKPKDDANRVLSVIEDYRNRERYKPGSLFGDAT